MTTPTITLIIPAGCRVEIQQADPEVQAEATVATPPAHHLSWATTTTGQDGYDASGRRRAHAHRTGAWWTWTATGARAAAGMADVDDGTPVALALTLAREEADRSVALQQGADGDRYRPRSAAPPQDQVEPPPGPWPQACQPVEEEATPEPAAITWIEAGDRLDGMSGGLHVAAVAWDGSWRAWSRDGHRLLAQGRVIADPGQSEAQLMREAQARAVAELRRRGVV